MHILRPYLRPAEWETLGVGPGDLCFTKFEEHWSFECLLPVTLSVSEVADLKDKFDLGPTLKKQYRAVRKKYHVTWIQLILGLWRPGGSKVLWSYMTSLLGPERNIFGEKLTKVESHAGKASLSSMCW